MPKRLISSLVIFLLLAPAGIAQTGAQAGAQTADNPQAGDTEAQKAEQARKAKLKASGYVLLNNLIGEIPALRLPENRVRAELTAGSLFWDKDPDRSRVLFRQAAADLIGFIDSSGTEESPQSPHQCERFRWRRILRRWTLVNNCLRVRLMSLSFSLVSEPPR